MNPTNTSSMEILFPISRDPPEGGTRYIVRDFVSFWNGFQFLGIPPKGELRSELRKTWAILNRFQFLGIPPKGERGKLLFSGPNAFGKFPISRDPPEGGTAHSTCKGVRIRSVSNF